MDFLSVQAAARGEPLDQLVEGRPIAFEDVTRTDCLLLEDVLDTLP